MNIVMLFFLCSNRQEIYIPLLYNKFQKYSNNDDNQYINSVVCAFADF